MSLSRFIDAADLKAQLHQVVVVDCDLPAAYQRFHIPGAHNAPCRYWKGHGSDEGLFAIDDAPRLAELVSPWGLSEGTTLIAYDSSGGLNAARLGWTLERFGWRDCRVLNGGLQAWHKAGGELTQEEPGESVSEVTFANPSDHTRCSLSQIVSLRDDPNHVFWDDRSEREWQGGFIPGAVHWEWTEVLTSEGTLRERAVLRDELAAQGITPDKSVTVYCLGGIRASHGYWLLKELGYPRVDVYDGSWAEYQTSGNPIQSP